MISRDLLLSAGPLFVFVSIGCGARTPLPVWEDAGSEEEMDASAPAFDARPPEPDAHTGLLLDCPVDRDDLRLLPGKPGQPIGIDGLQLVQVPIRTWQWRALPQGCDATLPAPRYQLSGTTEVPGEGAPFGDPQGK